MFFRRAKTEKNEGKPGEAGSPSAAPATAKELVQATGRAGGLTSAAPAGRLALSELRRTAEAKDLGFETTADVEPAGGLIGQDRALRAIEFGVTMKAPDFNMFVLGPPASGKSTAVTTYLRSIAAGEPTPDDWVYVNNFENQGKPVALRLPHGRAKALERSMIAAIDELRQTIPAIFEGEDYQARRRAIDEGFRSGQEEAFEVLNKKAQGLNIAILRTPTGFAMAPMHEGKVVKPEVFNALPDTMKKDVEQKIEALQKELEQILEQVPRVDKARREKLSELNAEIGAVAVNAALDDLKLAFRDCSDVVAQLDRAERDLVRNVGLFLAPSEEDNQIVKQSVDTSRDPRFRRYMVNLIVANGESNGAPIIEELNPNYGNLIGRVEHLAQMGALVTDFLLIRPGAMHRANGGYLLIDARKLLLSPFAWEALKRTIKGGEIRIEQPAEAAGLITTQMLDPAPIPINMRVILFGDRQLYYMLAAYDPDFTRIFKVQADFDDTIPRSGDNDRAYARLIASIVREHKLNHLDAGGVARLIDEGARLADDREKLTIEVGRIADIVREADYWSKKAGRSLITAADVSRAVEESIQRADRLRDRAQETIDRGIVLVDTEGAKVGQINGLSVLQLGSFAFGRPARITASVRMGQGRVTDIEREVNLGGPLHSKGVMILWGYLAGHFARDFPLALAASLVFEQSYGGVDGDSASSTELYGLLSALAGVPIDQGLAVTGSVNQHGEVQAIGGVNQKIEGFFDVCRARGLTGKQGVLIPQSNVQHLMLRDDVIEAVREGKFTIWSVATIDQGIEILTGVKAGERGEDGTFPDGTINRRVEDRLKEFADRSKQFLREMRSATGGDGATS